MNKYAIAIALIAFGFIIHSATADSAMIPSWIKTNAKYWKDGQLTDDEYVKGIEYLIQNAVIQIPPSDKVVEKSSKIPNWVKNNAGWWADGSMSDGEYVSAMQYLVSVGIIDAGSKTQNATQTMMPSSNLTKATTDDETLKCDKLTTAADKETCLDSIKLQKDLEEKIANSTPNKVGPVTYYIISTDLIDTGDGGVFINVHSILENTGSPSSNPDLFCTGPWACNYHLSDGKGDYPPSIFSLTSGHLELRYQKPVPIDWNFYSKTNIGAFTYDSSKSYSFKISEPFGSMTIPLKLTLQ